MVSTMVNIVDIIEKNPITKLSNTYNNKLLTRIKEVFTETEQQLFISSFYLYLNYKKDDFVVSLDDIWEWLGFSQKIRAKELLEKSFKEGFDYKTLLSCQRKKEGRGGANKITILLTVKCFKLLCIKSGTKKANEIHEYFIKLQEMLQDIILEECEEIKNQLKNMVDDVKEQLENKKEEVKEQLDDDENLDILKEYNKSLELQLKIKENEFNTKLYENPEFFDKLIKYQLIQNVRSKDVIEDNDIKEANRNEFTCDLEPLVDVFKSQKVRIIEFMKKNMKENINYIFIKNTQKKKGRGGSNIHKYYLNKESYELLKNSYNLRSKRIINDENINILLPIETRTLNVIINTFQDIFTCETQKHIGKYRCDLCIKEHKIVIECDEFGHKDRDIEYEEARDKYMIDNDYTVIRFNPNVSNFDIISVINVTNKVIFGVVNRKMVISV